MAELSLYDLSLEKSLIIRARSGYATQSPGEKTSRIVKVFQEQVLMSRWIWLSMSTPCIARAPDVGEDLSQAFKNFFVVIVSKNFPAVHSPDYNVVESTRGVCSGASWHGAGSACPCQKRKSKFHGHPLLPSISRPDPKGHYSFVSICISVFL